MLLTENEMSCSFRCSRESGVQFPGPHGAVGFPGIPVVLV